MRLWLWLLAAVLLCALLVGHPATPLWVKVAIEASWLLGLSVVAAFQLWRTLRGQMHLLRARLGVPTSRAPTHYVRRLFDEYAGHYDEHLLVELSYAGPNLLRDLVAERVARGSAVIGDLGCGTGVLAPLFRGLASRLVGVDLSRRMLRAAGARELYDELVEADIVLFLHDRPARFDLLLAADVLVYLGDLDAFLAGAAHALRDDGLLAVTTEHAAAGTYMLLPSGRFAHAVDYLEETARAHGLALVERRQGALRTEGGVPIVADLWLFGRQRR